MEQQLKIVQMTDTHIKTAPGGHIDGAKSEAALRAAVAHINALEERLGGIDAVIHTGDLTDTGLDDEYALFNAVLSDLNAPFFATPGNHDARGPMRAAGLAPSGAAADGPMHTVVKFSGAQAILLDTVTPGASHGELGAEAIDWAERAIKEAAAQGDAALVFAHHPPFACGVGYMDAIRLRDGDALRAMLAAQPNLRLFSCGHNHRMLTTTIGAAAAFAAPAIAVQLELDLRARAAPTPTSEQSAVLAHVWRAAPAPFGAVSSYLSAF